MSVLSIFAAPEVRYIGNIEIGFVDLELSRSEIFVADDWVMIIQRGVALRS